MRTAAAVSMLLCLEGCGQPDPPPINRLEIWAPGLEVQIDGLGRGSFQKRSTNQNGRFVLPTKRFAEVRTRLEPFRRSDEAISESELREQLLKPCPHNYVTDQGGMTIHWSGPALDRWYQIDFGCDPERNAGASKELQTILSSLPVPEPDSLP